MRLAGLHLCIVAGGAENLLQSAAAEVVTREDDCPGGGEAGVAPRLVPGALSLNCLPQIWRREDEQEDRRCNRNW
jgi:hypothetical protein